MKMTYFNGGLLFYFDFAGHIFHRCGWPFQKSHPSSKHRRAHKKICGTIEGYPKLIDSEAVSDDEHYSDEEDIEITPSEFYDLSVLESSFGFFIHLLKILIEAMVISYDINVIRRTPFVFGLFIRDAKRTYS